MEILEITKHTPLKTARNHLIFVVLCYVFACLLFPFLIESIAAFNFIFLAILCYSLYAVYVFSKIARAGLFRSYVTMCSIQFLVSILLGFLLSFVSLEVVFLVGIVIILVSSMYFSFKMADEMSALTDLPHFVTAWRLYALSSCVIVCMFVFVPFGLDMSNLTQGLQTESDIIALVETNKTLLLAAIFLLFVVSVTTLIGIGFVLRGLLKMCYVKINQGYIPQS